MTNLDSILKSRDITLPTKVRLVKAMVFPVVMYGCESWTMKKAECRRILNCGVGEDSWEFLGLQGYQPWDFFGGKDAEAETAVLWPPHAKTWLIGKDSDAGRDWGQEKGTTESEMAGWHHWLDGRESGWTPGVGDGQGGLACCDSWGCKELDTTERLIWSDLIWKSFSKRNQMTWICHWAILNRSSWLKFFLMILLLLLTILFSILPASRSVVPYIIKCVTEPLI